MSAPYHPLSRREIGHRVVVRHRLETGQLTDVVGVLASYDEPELIVRRADATTQVIRVTDIAAAKPVPPTPLRRVDLDAILLATAHGRPAAETERLGEWLLRASGGWTGRGNSVLPYGDPGMPVADALDRAVEFYHARDLPALALVPLGTPAEEAIRDHGWVEARPSQSDTLVLHTTLDLVNAEPAVQVVVSDCPDQDWYDVAYADGVPPTAPAVLEGAAVSAFAAVRLDGRTVAAGRAAMTGHWVGVDSVAVSASYRRRGLGTAVLQALARWGGTRGGRRTYLEVVEENAGALAAYTALGYREAYRYRYLMAP